MGMRARAGSRRAACRGGQVGDVLGAAAELVVALELRQREADRVPASALMTRAPVAARRRRRAFTAATMRAIAGAAAEVARERAPDRRLVGRRIGGEQRVRGDQHAGRAEAALEGAARRNARCSACIAVASSRPSSVRTGRPTQPCASDRQERIGTPSIRTVQAPQTPWLQPRFAAVRCSSSRSTVSSVVDRPARTSAATPLMSSSTRVETGLRWWIVALHGSVPASARRTARSSRRGTSRRRYSALPRTSSSGSARASSRAAARAIAALAAVGAQQRVGVGVAHRRRPARADHGAHRPGSLDADTPPRRWRSRRRRGRASRRRRHRRARRRGGRR